MRYSTFGVLALASILAASAAMPLLAHHSFAAEYDSKQPVTLKGAVTKIEWMNPHVYFYIDVKDEQGNVTNWGFETANPNSLFRRGYKKGLVAPGMVVTIQGYLAKDGSHTGNAHQLTMPDGKVVALGSETNPG